MLQPFDSVLSETAWNLLNIEQIGLWMNLKLFFFYP